MEIKLPAEKYIKKNTETEIITIRVPPSLKKEAIQRSDEYGTSINRICEAALLYYFEALDKKRKI